MDIVSWTFANPPVDEDKPLYIDPGNTSRSLSFAQTKTLVRKLIAGFTHHGVQQRDCVCVVSLNDIHYTPLYLSIIGSGAIFTGANPGYTSRELIHHLRITGAKYILTSLKSLSVSLTAAEECGIPICDVFVLDYLSEDVPLVPKSWMVLLRYGEKAWEERWGKGYGDGEVAYVSTSGTSGLPKAAILGHGYLVSQGEMLEEMFGSEGNEISSLIAIPPFHVFTMPVQHALPLRTGTPAYIMPRFEEGRFIFALKDFHISYTVVVPPIMMALSKRTAGELKSLRRIFVGGSCATDGMQSRLYPKLAAEAKIVQVYGMTEVGWATCWSREARDETGSVGQPVAGTTLRIVDSSGQAVNKDGITGEVQIHTPYAMKEYLDNPTGTAEARTEDGWVRTGDVGYTRDGNWYIIDRTKDLIKVRGWQVSPAEIEAALLEHPGVLDAGVIAAPASDGCGEVPLAFIVKNETAQIDQRGVKGFLGARLARYKNVEEVEFVDKIPRNPTGKILRRVLRDTRSQRPKTADQVAAFEYASALKNLDEYQRSRGSASASSRGGKEQSSVSEVEIGPEKTGRKRKYCPASKFMHWRKLRCASKGPRSVVAGSVPPN